MSVVAKNPVIRRALIEARLNRCERTVYETGSYLEETTGGPSAELDAAYAEYNAATEAERKARRALRKAVTL